MRPLRLRQAAFHLLPLLAAACAATAGHDGSQPIPDTFTRTWVRAGEMTADFELEVPVTGRYRCELDVEVTQGAVVWLEAYPDNADGRTYDITGPIHTPGGAHTLVREGSPLAAGTIPVRLHAGGEACVVRDVRLTLLRPHVETPQTLVQSTEGSSWELAWADEFDGEGLPDPAKWTHDLGNWGWGNKELQYYTEDSTANARQEGGRLVIEAHPVDGGASWTSARLTTRGKVAFQYGRIEIRAKVPATDGTWAAGWTLGDAYRDELSWPYCGEIDICEAVGREIDDATGDGINHASCHTRAYYFKQGNHISNVLPVADMSEAFHDYVCEWDEGEVRMYVDGEHYYTYDKTADALEWPFAEPQCLILNLAMGGGMGGPVAADAGPQRFEIEHVRVYERR